VGDQLHGDPGHATATWPFADPKKSTNADLPPVEVKLEPLAMFAPMAPNWEKLILSFDPVPFQDTTVSANAVADHRITKPVAASKFFLSMNPPVNICFISTLLNLPEFPKFQWMGHYN
jgi:hypothetical protein